MRLKRLRNKNVPGKRPTWVSHDWRFKIVTNDDWIKPYTLEVQSFLPGGPVKGPRSLTLPHWHTVGAFGTLTKAQEKISELAGLNR